MIYSHCARCRRPVLFTNLVVVEGKGYGKSCSEKVGDLLTQPQRRVQITSRRRKQSGDSRQLQLEVSL